MQDHTTLTQKFAKDFLFQLGKMTFFSNGFTLGNGIPVAVFSKAGNNRDAMSLANMRSSLL